MFIYFIPNIPYPLFIDLQFCGNAESGIIGAIVKIEQSELVT
jgi:hypothetical protein